jgi:hypothetical protein
LFALFGGKPIVDFVDNDFDKVTVRSSKRFTLAKEHNVLLRMRPGKDVPLYPYRMFAIWEKPSAPIHGGYTYGFRMVSPGEIPQEDQNEAGRQKERVGVVFRALSRKLPEFSAVTVDLSESGLQLEMRGALEVGEQLDMRIEADMTDWQEVAFRAKVMWCRAEEVRRGERSSFLAGFQYVDPDETARQRIAELAKFISSSRTADVAQRTLSGADQLLFTKKEEELS